MIDQRYIAALPPTSSPLLIPFIVYQAPLDIPAHFAQSIDNFTMPSSQSQHGRERISRTQALEETSSSLFTTYRHPHQIPRTTYLTDTTANANTPDFASLPSTLLHQLTKTLTADDDLRTLARLNVTCRAIRQVTTAALWRRVVCGGKYEWAERFGRAVCVGRSIDTGLAGLQACVRLVYTLRWDRYEANRSNLF